MPVRMIIALAGIIFLAGCRSGDTTMDSASKSRFKQEILEAEKAFAETAAQKDLAAAFLEFAAEDAVLNRNDEIIQGREAMKEYFSRSTLKNVRLAWTPDFVDVSDDGTLGYTYGPYTFEAYTQDGDTVKAEGLFHTVWKRQSDGSWRFVYD